MEDIINQEIICLEFVELMRNIKQNSPEEFIKLNGALEVLAQKKANKIKSMKTFTVDELIIKLLDIQNLCQFEEMREKKKQIIEKVLHSDSIRDIKIINAFTNGIVNKKEIS